MTDANKAFIKAAKAGDVDTLKTLLKAEKTVLAAKDSDGSSALHCACWKGHLEAVKFLLKAGCDVHAHNANEHWGTTPLHAASHANQAAIAQLLIDAGPAPMSMPKT